MRESEVEKYLVERVKAMDGEVRKVRWIGRNGAPDRLVMLPERVREESRYVRGEPCGKQSCQVSPLTLWVELKAPGEKPRPHQVREHERMRRMGQTVVVIDSLEGVDEALA